MVEVECPRYRGSDIAERPGASARGRGTGLIITRRMAASVAAALLVATAATSAWLWRGDATPQPAAARPSVARATPERRIDRSRRPDLETLFDEKDSNRDGKVDPKEAAYFRDHPRRTTADGRLAP